MKEKEREGNGEKRKGRDEKEDDRKIDLKRVRGCRTAQCMWRAIC